MKKFWKGFKHIFALLCPDTEGLGEMVAFAVVYIVCLGLAAGVALIISQVLFYVWTH